MKKYFEKLQSIGLEAIAELRKMDTQRADQLIKYREQVMKGDSTEMGYQNLKCSLDNRRAQTVADYTAKLGTLEKEFAAAVDDAMMPSARRINAEDAEVLKTFELTPAEFERMAAKYQDNPTMGRLLEDYRAKHEGTGTGKSAQSFTGMATDAVELWHTSWRFQNTEERKAIFNSASNSVRHIFTGVLDESGAFRVKKRVSQEYHKLQGSDPNALPIPEAPAVKSVMERITERGGFFF